MPAEGVTKRQHSNILRVEEILEIAEAAVELGIRKIRITGGEPLLRRGLLDICKGVKELGIDDLAVTTNGILLRDFAEPLKNSGVNRVNVSLDTLKPEVFRKLTRSRGSAPELQNVLDGIDAAKLAGLTPIKLNCVLMRGVNDGEIEDIADFAERMDVELRFIELMPIGQAKDMWRERYLPNSEVIKRLGLKNGVQRGVAMQYGRIGLIDPVSRAFCPTCNRIRLTADGNIKPCLHSAREIPVRNLHGAELRGALTAAILSKPEAHDGLSGDAPSRSQRGMNKIGG
jgi:cyclic pyranopterin phosphate synthase